MNKIVIKNGLEKELTLILSHLCIQVQKEFDICPALLSKIINEVSFNDHCKFLYEQCHSEMNTQLTEFKDKFNLLTENNGNKIEIYSDKYEKCGHVIKSFRNGHIQYCNLHKYLHAHESYVCDNHNYTPQLNHEFITKSNEQIIKEHYYISIHNIYKNYMNKLFIVIKQLFNYYIYKDCDVSTLKIDTLNAITKQMSENQNIFKSKVLYEHISSDIDGKRQTELYLKQYNYRYPI